MGDVVNTRFVKLGDWVEGNALGGGYTAGNVIQMNLKNITLKNGKTIKRNDIKSHSPVAVVSSDKNRIVFDNGMYITRKPDEIHDYPRYFNPDDNGGNAA